jgi:hypothetical protein
MNGRPSQNINNIYNATFSDVWMKTYALTETFFVNQNKINIINELFIYRQLISQHSTSLTMVLINEFEKEN